MAKWKFREFNEFPHQLDERLKLAVSPANCYIDQFVSFSMIIFCKFVIFTSGSILIFLLIASFFAPDILNEEILLGRDGIWWIAICGCLLGIARSFVPSEDFVFQPEHYFNQVHSHTHYLPTRWKLNTCRSPRVLKEFSSLFEYRILSLLSECLSVLMVPFVLLFSLPQCADDIIFFISENTVEVDGVGEICAFSNFNLQENGNTKFGAPVEGTKTRTNNGKLEKSIATFITAYPSYDPPDDSKALLESLSNFAVSFFSFSKFIFFNLYSILFRWNRNNHLLWIL